jgi:hypothetical protein
MVKLQHELLTIIAALLIVPSSVNCFNENNNSDELISTINNFSQKKQTTASADSYSTLALPITQQIIINPYNETEHSFNLNLTATATTTSLNGDNLNNPSIYDFITTTNTIPTTSTKTTTSNPTTISNTYGKNNNNEYSQYADDSYDSNVREGGARHFPEGYLDFPNVQLPPEIGNYDVYTPAQPQGIFTPPYARNIPIATASSPYYGGYADPTDFPSNEYQNQRPTIEIEDLDEEPQILNLPSSVPIPQPVPSSIINDLSTLSSSTASSIPTPRSTKQSKQIPTYKSSADEVLRNFVKDSYLRSPTAILIDTSGKAHNKAQTMWRATLWPNKSSLQNTALDMVLVTYNSSGEFLIASFIFRKKKVCSKLLAY